MQSTPQRSRRSKLRHFAVTAIMLLSAGVAPALAPPAQAAIGGDFVDELDWFNTDRWHVADGWSNGGMFNAGWRAGHVRFEGGRVNLLLDTNGCPGACSGKPYAAGEIRSNDMYQYGRFEVRMKAAKGPGMVSSFFTYGGPSDGLPWDEIDVEILGNDTRKLHTNYFTNGVGGHETVIDLGFDAAAGFHNYAIEWQPGSIKWFVDGRLVHQENGSRGALPSNPQRIMMNLWPSVGVDNWTGRFTYNGQKSASYEWVKYSKQVSGGGSGNSLPTGTGTLISGNLCLDVPWGNSASGTQLQVVNCNGNTAQRFTRHADGRITILGKCVDAASNGSTNGTRVQLWNCNGTAAQKWTRSGTTLRSSHGLCVDANQLTDGARVHLWRCHGGANQDWRL